eukprot:GFUD01012638.1.p1 GENE.GFUD01012638.1~~GFUD01012638.1.p1  ORF type:complete len:327 (-),score=61.52 GFUD01012638.1:46-1026(-)
MKILLLVPILILLVEKVKFQRPSNYRPNTHSFQECSKTDEYLSCARKCEKENKKFCYFKGDQRKTQPTYAGCIAWNQFWYCCNDPWINDQACRVDDNGFSCKNPQYFGNWIYMSNTRGHPTCRHGTDNVSGGNKESVWDVISDQSVEVIVCYAPSYLCRDSSYFDIKNKDYLFSWSCLSPDEVCNELNQTENYDDINTSGIPSNNGIKPNGIDDNSVIKMVGIGNSIIEPAGTDNNVGRKRIDLDNIDATSDKEDNLSSTLGIIIPCVTSGVSFLFIAVILVICKRRKKKAGEKETVDENFYYGDEEDDYQETAFTDNNDYYDGND